MDREDLQFEISQSIDTTVNGDDVEYRGASKEELYELQESIRIIIAKSNFELEELIDENYLQKFSTETLQQIHNYLTEADRI
jgi:hypothetical protein